MRSLRLVLLASTATLVPLAWSSLDLTSAAPIPTANALSPAERVCVSQPAATSFVSIGFVDLVTCTISVSGPGTAYITGSMSISPNSDAATPTFEAKLVVDGMITPASVFVDLYRNPLWTGHRNVSIKDGVHLPVGTHNITLRLYKSEGDGTARVQRPAVSAYVVPDADEASACFDLGDVTTFATGGRHSSGSCQVVASSYGFLRISGGGTIKANGRGVFTTRLEVGSDDVSSSHMTDVGDEAKFVWIPLAQMSTIPVAPGTYTVRVSAERDNGPSAGSSFVNPSIQAIFIPGTSDTTSECHDSNPAGTAHEVPIELMSCSITMPRAGRIEALATGEVSSIGTGNAYVFLRLNGQDLLSNTIKYVSSLEAEPELTMLTQLGIEVAAGIYTVQFVAHKSQASEADVILRQGALSLIGAYPAPGDPAPPPTSPPTSVPDDPDEPDAPDAPAAVRDYIPLVPERVLDTRGPSPIGYVGGKPAAGQTVPVQVTGVGTSNVPGDAKSVVLNLTGSDAASDGFVTVWPCGAPQPTASNLNVKAGADVPNLVIAKVGDGGKVCLFTQPSQHLIADISGYMPAGSSYVPVVPDRVLETRAEGQRGYTGAKPGPGDVVQLDVTGVGSSQLPDSASAVVLNVTGTEASGNGYVTVWPCGTPQPVASNLNLVVGVDRPNLVVSKIGQDGKVCLFTQGGAHLIADVNGYLPAGAGYTPVVPLRILETRAPNQIGYSGDKPGAGAIVQLHVTGDGAAPSTATAVVLNVTGTEATGAGFVTVWPCGAAQPTASNLNLTAGATAPNLVMSKIGDGGNVCIFAQSGVHLIADLAGYWTS